MGEICGLVGIDKYTKSYGDLFEIIVGGIYWTYMNTYTDTDIMKIVIWLTTRTYYVQHIHWLIDNKITKPIEDVYCNEYVNNEKYISQKKK